MKGLRLVDEALVAATARRAVADRHRHRLLQHDRVLPRRVRAAPRARVDRGADAVVRAPARDGRAQRPLPRPSRRDHAAARRMVDDALGEASRAAERFTDGVLNQLARGPAQYCKGEIHRLRGELAQAEDAYPRGEPVRLSSRSRASRLLRLAQGDAEQRRPPHPPSGGRDHRPAQARRAAARVRRDHARRGRARQRAAAACRELAEIAAAARERRAWQRWPRRPRSGGAGRRRRRRQHSRTCGRPARLA